MSIKKKVAACACAVTMALSLASCGDTSYVMKTDKYTVSAGMYLDYMLEELNTQMQTLYYKGITSDYLEQKYSDTQTVGQHLSEFAYDKCVEAIVINKKFDEMGLSLTDEELSKINDNLSSVWESYSKYYESNGISKASLKEILNTSAKSYSIFRAYYYDGGLEEVTTEDINDYLSDNYIRFKLLTIEKDTSDPSSTKAEELAKKYAEMAKVSSLDEVIEEYQEFMKKQTEESLKNDASGSGTPSDDSSTVTTASSDSSQPDSTTDTSSDAQVTTTDSSSQPEVTTNQEVTTVASPSPSSATGDTTTAEKEDPYKNEACINKNSDSYKDNEVIKYVDEKMSFDTISTYSDDKNWYVIEKLDILKREDYAKDNHDSLLSEMKSDAFAELLDEWEKELDIEVNTKAIDRYTPETVYKKMVDANSSK